MARAETVESVGENGPLPRHHNTCCRMELPRPFSSWPGLLSTSPVHMHSSHHQHHNHYLHHPLQALYPFYPPHPGAEDQPHMHQQNSATPPPALRLRNRREERTADGALHRALSDSAREATGRRGPLPDLLPRNELPSWAPPPAGAAPGVAQPGLEVRRLAGQLRKIGDEFNATVLHRVRAAAPLWQDWRGACRGLVNFLGQTLSTLYRLT